MLTTLLTDAPLLRAALAGALSLGLALVCGPAMIRWLRTWSGDRAESRSATLQKLHADKVGTPTMGGLLLLLALAGGLIVAGDLTNAWVQGAILALGGFGAVGAIDDLRKLRSAGRGLSPRGKLLGQLCVATTIGVWLAAHPGVHATLFVPGQGPVTLGPWLALLCVIVLLATTNAVNLADGLDGLAGGCVLPATVALGALLYFKPEIPAALMNGTIENHATPPHTTRELLVVAGSLLGATLGFLRFNLHPARLFMGDTGALALGGALGLLAVASGRAWAWLAIGGVFVAETLSVMVQVTWFRWTGRRVFRCAPLHHHFQFGGWAETTIVRRFWWAAVACALVGATLASWTLYYERAALDEGELFATRATVTR